MSENIQIEMDAANTSRAWKCIWCLTRMLVNVLDIHLHFGHHQIMEEYCLDWCSTQPQYRFAGRMFFIQSVHIRSPQHCIKYAPYGIKESIQYESTESNDLKELSFVLCDSIRIGRSQFQGATGQTERRFKTGKTFLQAKRICCTGSASGWKSCFGNSSWRQIRILRTELQTLVQIARTLG